MITYTDVLGTVTVDLLRWGFFAGWPHPPSPAVYYRVLANSAAIEPARLRRSCGQGE